MKYLKSFIEIVIVIIALYMIIFPFVPEIVFQIKKHTKTEELNNEVLDVLTDSSTSGDDVAGNISSDDSTNRVINSTISTKVEPTQNLLFIPSIGLKEEILEGINESTLNLGVWRKPDSATPELEKGNVVLTGHRFGYLSAAQRVFYNLDKVKIGDSVIVFWNGKDYTYTVEQVFEVSPDSLFVEGQSEQKTLTLYTCTPLWTSDRRLVVKAKYKL